MRRISRYCLKDEEAIKQLSALLHYVFPGAETLGLENNEVLELWMASKEQQRGIPRVLWNDVKKTVVAFLFSKKEEQIPHVGVTVRPLQEPKELDLKFANCLVRVLNEDILTLNEAPYHSELWDSLRQTQFRRAIARFSAFSTVSMVRWMQIMENSTSLRYEGYPFSVCVYITKQRKWLVEPLGSAFVQFSTPIPFNRAVLSEKWIRSAASELRVGLVGVGHSGRVVGMIAIPRSTPNTDIMSFAPHEDLLGICNLIRPGTMVFVTSIHSDVYTILANGAVFHKSQNRWRYLNYEATHDLLASRMDPTIASSILKTTLDLSYERRGALICVTKEPESVPKFVPDYSRKGRANEALRKAVKGLQICEQNHRKIIASAATVDGALIIDEGGYVLDVACMVCDPPLEDLESVEQNQLRRMEGARSTAAWNASIYGIAIKVSEDGPVTIFERGKLIGRLGG